MGIPIAGKQEDIRRRSEKNGGSKNEFGERNIGALIQQSGEQHLRQAVMLMARRAIRGGRFQRMRRAAFKDAGQSKQCPAEGNVWKFKLIGFSERFFGTHLFRRRRTEQMLMETPVTVVVPYGQHIGSGLPAGVRMHRAAPAVLNQLMQHRAEANRSGKDKAQGQVAGNELVKTFHSFVSVCHTYSLKK